MEVLDKIATDRLPFLISKGCGRVYSGQMLNYFWGFVIFSLPFIFSSSVFDPSLLPQLFFLQIALLFSIPMGLLAFPGELRWHFSYLSVFLLCFLVFSLLSILSATNQYEAIVEAQKLFTFITFFFFASYIFNPGSFQCISGVASLCGLFLSCIALAQHYHLMFEKIPGFGDLRATLSNKNMLASALTLILPFTLYGVFKLKRPYNFFVIVILFPILFCLLLSGIRSAVLAFIISTLIGGGLCLLRRIIFKLKSNTQRFQSVLIVFTALVVIVCLFLLIGGNFYFQKICTLIKTSYLQSDFNRPKPIAERLAVWDATGRMIKENPLYGVGLGNWRIEFARFGTASTSARWGLVHFQRPHNDFLWILSETGIGGLLSFLLVILLFFIYFFRIYNVCPLYRFEALCLAMVMISYLVDSFFSFPKERIVHSLYFYLCLSMMVSIYYTKFQHDRVILFKKSTKIYTCSTVFFIFLLWCAHTSWQRIVAEKHVREGINLCHQQNWQGAERHFTSAIDLEYQLDPYSSSVYWRRGNTRIQQKLFSTAYQDFYLAFLQHPFNIVHLNELGSCAAVQGDHELAISWYKKALVLSPKHEMTLANLAAEYANTHRYEEAQKIYFQLIAETTQHKEKYERNLQRIYELEVSATGTKRL